MRITILFGLLALQTAGSSSEGARNARNEPSFLARGCVLRTTMGADWGRLWLDCGCGRYLVTEASSLTGHVKIDSLEKAMEFVRFFSGEGACEMLPNPQWVEIVASDGDRWHALSSERFRQLCPAPVAHEITQSTSAQRVYRVRRCLLSLSDGDLYDVEEQVLEDGTVDVYQRKRVLKQATDVVGRCSPGMSAPPDRDSAAPATSPR